MRHDQQAPHSRTAWLLAGLSGLLLAASASLCSASPSDGGVAEKGLWFNNSGKGAVEIRPCSDRGREANYLCGYIVWLKEPNNKKGEPLHDGYNADPKKRTRPICGLPVLGLLRPMSDGTWDQGWVYDPEQGKSYDASIEVRSPERLVLTGYKGIKFFGKSFVWQRAPDDLPRCDNSLNGAADGKAPVNAAVKAAVKVGNASPPLPDKASLARASQLGVLTPPRPVPAVKQPSAAMR
jgi:uncharacterized protein (DUF2147 family)